MDELMSTLLLRLAEIQGVEVRPSPVAGGVGLFCRGKDLGHFHHARELDLRMGKQAIKALGLSHPVDSTFHPGRSPNSPWIELRYRRLADLDAVVALVRQAAAR